MNLHIIPPGFDMLFDLATLVAIVAGVAKASPTTGGSPSQYPAIAPGTVITQCRVPGTAAITYVLFLWLCPRMTTYVVLTLDGLGSTMVHIFGLLNLSTRSTRQVQRQRSSSTETSTTASTT